MGLRLNNRRKPTPNKHPRSTQGLDPQRTAGLRRSFNAEVKRMVGVAVAATSRGMPSLTANVFCPTGQGGGVDPTCSPKSEPVEFGDSVHDRYPDAPKISVTDERFEKVKTALKKAGKLNSDGTITLYHDTLSDPEVIKSIQEKGFIPAHSSAPGQTWVAAHSKYATYFHVDEGAARGLLDTAEDEFVSTVKVRVPLTKDLLNRVVPDEESDPDPLKGPEALAETFAVGIIGGIPPQYVEGGKKRPTPTTPVKEQTQPLDDHDAIEAAGRELMAKKYRGKLSLGSRAANLLYKSDKTRWSKLSGAYADSVLQSRGITANSSSQDVERFEQWFAALMDRIVLQPSREVIARYVDLSFRTGSGRVFDDFHSGRSRVGEPAGLREGMRKQFVEDLAGFQQTTVTVNAFGFIGRAADKVRTVTARVYNDLKSVVQGIVNRGTRVVADAVERNKEPSQVTRQVLEEVKRGLDGMITTAGDAVSRGYVAGQIAALRQLGVRSVTPAVEWTVKRERDGTIAKTVCKLCRPLDGLVFTVDEAEGLFPRHPKCQCSLMIPTRYGIRRKIRVDSKDEIEDAITRSRGKAKSQQGWAKDVKIGKVRPTRNVFCPTGAGGGIDPTCSPGDVKRFITDLDYSWSDRQTFREELNAGRVKDGTHVVEPYVYTVKDGKSTIHKDFKAVYDYQKNGYKIENRELPPENLLDRTYTHSTDADLLRVEDLKPGKEYGNFGQNEYDAIYLAQEGYDGNPSWGKNVYRGKIKKGTKLASDKEATEAWKKHPEMGKQEAVEAEGYHGVYKLDPVGDVWEVALFSNRLVGNSFRLVKNQSSNEWSAPSAVVNAYSSLRTAAGLGLQQQEQSNGHGQ